MTPYLKILYIVCGALNLLIALFVVFRHYDSRGSRHFVYFILSTLFWTASLYFGYFYTSPHIPEKSLFYIRGAYGTSIFMGFFLVSFFYLFPRKTFKVHRILKGTFVTMTLVLAFLSFFTGFVHEAQIVENGVYVADKLGPLYLVYLLYFVASLIGAGAIAINKVLKSTGLERKKMLIAAAGCWVFLFFGFVLNVVLPLFHIYLLPKQAVMFALTFTIPTFYSMQRYRFFNFSYTSMRVLRWVVLLAAFFGPLLMASLNLHLFFTATSEELLVIASGMIALIVFMVMMKFFPALLGEHFRKPEFKVKTDHF